MGYNAGIVGYYAGIVRYNVKNVGYNVENLGYNAENGPNWETFLLTYTFQSLSCLFMGQNAF